MWSKGYDKFQLPLTTLPASGGRVDRSTLKSVSGPWRTTGEADPRSAFAGNADMTPPNSDVAF
jgi:hypothetical protein